MYYNNNNSKTGLIVAIVFGIIFFCLLSGLLVYFMTKSEDKSEDKAKAPVVITPTVPAVPTTNPIPTPAEEEAAAIEAENQINLTDQQEASRDPTTPGTPTTETAVSTPASAEDFTQLCRTHKIDALSYFNRKVNNSQEFNQGTFLPELKRFAKGNRMIDTIRNEDISYNPTTQQCVYNIRPFGYEPRPGSTPRSVFFPRRPETIGIEIVKNFK